jgi:hypothetical protein
MICPQCGITQSDDLKFCKSCGANLQAVRIALANPEKLEDKFEWSNWITKLTALGEEHNKRMWEQDNPEQKRYNEIKAGVITGSVGLALMIFLAIFMQGLIASGIPQDAAAILSRVWIAGIIPFFIGLALIFNGVVVSKKLVELRKRELQQKDTARMLEAEKEGVAIPAADWYEEASPTPSVTEHTTRQLRDADQRQ